MEKTRDRAVYVTTSLSLWGIGLTVSNPWLVGWLWLSAVGALVFAIKPEWASIRLWGKKARATPEVTQEPLFRFRGKSRGRMEDTETEGEGPLLDVDDSDFKSKGWKHKK